MLHARDAIVSDMLKGLARGNHLNSCLLFDLQDSWKTVGRTWKPAAGVVVPVGRGEAVLLSAALDETMPSGALAGEC